MSGLRWVAGGAGLLLVAAGLATSARGLVQALDPEASGLRLGQLELGARFFLALLVLHGGLLLAAALRRRSPGAPAATMWQPPSGSAEASRGATPRELAILAGILAVAAGVRWIGIHQDLWLDEVFTLVDFVRPPLGLIVTDYHEDNQHLLYSVLAHLCVSWLGESEAAVRLPALLLGLASLWATWSLARLVASPREALLAVALLALSYHHVWFSQNARGYTGLLFATILSTELLLRGLWHPRASTWLAYALTLALGMGFHLAMIFVPAGHALLILWQTHGTLRAGRWRPLAALALAGTLTLQLYALVLPQIFDFYTQPAAGTTVADVEWKNPLWLVNETIRGLGVGLGLGWAGILAGGAVFAIGGLAFLRRAPLATVCFVLPAALGAGVLLALERNLWPRFFFNQMAFAALFAVHGTLAVGDWAGRRIGRPSPHWGTALASALILASALTLPRAVRLPKQDFTGARDFVRAEMQPGDRVVGIGMAGKVYRAHYEPSMALALTLEELERQLAPQGRTWIVYTLGSYIAATRPALWEAIETRFEEVRAFPGTLGGGAVVVRRSRLPEDD